MSVNKVILIGRLGQDPELRFTPAGSAVCNFSVATSESWTDKTGHKQERPEWHRVVVWGKQAELCNQYLFKGRQAFIEGKLSTRSWEDKNGQKRYTTEIQANAIQFLGSANANGPTPSSSNQSEGGSPDTGAGTNGQSMMDKNYQVSSDANFTADDIPF